MAQPCRILPAGFPGLKAWGQALDEPEPQQMFANRQGVEIWSSAEEGRYIVARMAKGAPLKVYDRRGEWLAIRPPEGCFSWTPASAIAETDTPGIVQVVSQGARSWVGGEDQQSAPPRPQSSVQLDRGERLVQLGQWDLTTPSGRIVETWIRIAPPAGEFRWVHRDDVSTRPPTIESADEAVDSADESARPVGWNEDHADQGSEPVRREPAGGHQPKRAAGRRIAAGPRGTPAAGDRIARGTTAGQ